MLTDVAMPKMNGRELYSRLARIRPGIKVVYMSGYSHNAVAHRGALDPGTFFIAKPFKGNELLHIVRDALNAEPAAVEIVKNGTVLLIDDEKSMRIVVPRFLEEDQYEVITAKNGEEGIRLFRERVGEIDLVLLDRTLPDLDGMEVLRRLRELRGDIPVVIVSGDRSDDFSQVLQRNDRMGFLPKPFVRKDLLAAVREAKQA